MSIDATVDQRFGEIVSTSWHDGPTGENPPVDSTRPAWELPAAERKVHAEAITVTAEQRRELKLQLGRAAAEMVPTKLDRAEAKVADLLARRQAAVDRVNQRLEDASANLEVARLKYEASGSLKDRRAYERAKVREARLFRTAPTKEQIHGRFARRLRKAHATANRQALREQRRPLVDKDVDKAARRSRRLDHRANVADYLADVAKDAMVSVARNGAPVIATHVLEAHFVNMRGAAYEASASAGRAHHELVVAERQALPGHQTYRRYGIGRVAIYLGDSVEHKRARIVADLQAEAVAREQHQQKIVERLAARSTRKLKLAAVAVSATALILL